MKFAMKSWKLSAAFVCSLFLLPAVTQAQHYNQTNLVSDVPGMAPVTDPNLVNPWGLTRSSGSPWWSANNNSGTSTLYDGKGNIIPLVVTIPAPKGAPAGTQSTPTGTVFNGSPTDFLLAAGKQAIFLFVTEDGTISGWSPGIDLHNAVLKVDNSDGGGADGAVYKGATTADVNGKRFLYVTNFRSGKVEVYDTNFKRVRLDDDAFDDDSIPRGFAAFNVQNVGGSLFVTYAKQDGPRHDPVGGDGLGFVDIYSPSGRLEKRLQHGPWLNAPWGVVWTPRDFGEFSNRILVGNFRSGWIAAYNGFTGKFIGFMKHPDDSLVTIDGLWALAFGNGATAGPFNSLYFTAGIQNELHGLFGTLTPVASEQDGDEE
jgi:uncharacterized protein (TIGR03118 family)